MEVQEICYFDFQRCDWDYPGLQGQKVKKQTPGSNGFRDQNKEIRWNVACRVKRDLKGWREEMIDNRWGLWLVCMGLPFLIMEG